VSGVANQLSTPFTLLLAWPLLGERPTARVVVGVAVALGGVVLTVAEPGAAVKIVPTLLVIAAGFAWAVGSVLTKRYGPLEPLKLMAWMSLFTVPQEMVTSLLIEHGQLAALQAASLTAWLAFAYTVLAGAVAGWGLWFWLIARCSMTRLAPFGLLQMNVRGRSRGRLPGRTPDALARGRRCPLHHRRRHQPEPIRCPAWRAGRTARRSKPPIHRA
jgi:O-acetylserine/cysteine efflux transporter